MNAMNAPSKRSTLEKKLDKLIITIFCVLLTMCLIGAIGWYGFSSILWIINLCFDLFMLQFSCPVVIQLAIFVNFTVQLWRIVRTNTWVFRIISQSGNTVMDSWYIVLHSWSWFPSTSGLLIFTILLPYAATDRVFHLFHASHSVLIHYTYLPLCFYWGMSLLVSYSNYLHYKD